MERQERLTRLAASALLAGLIVFAAIVGTYQPGSSQTSPPKQTSTGPAETRCKPGARCGDAPKQDAGGKAASEPRKIQIDLNKAVAVKLPPIAQDLKPIAFQTPDGKQGWALRIPGGRPIATPAFSKGLLFVGGGYGSHEFYAVNAQTGVVVWKIQTGDDGPTAAVVEDGKVAFNTESCTVIVVDEKTGKVIWQEWLGDPLMSQPAIAKGRLFIAYPGGQRNKPQQNAQSPATGAPPRQRMSHRLLAADLNTGRHLWEQEIPADVISAPVVEGDTVYITCFEGTSMAFNAADGRVLWRKQNAGTSAPIVKDGQLIVARKNTRSGKAYEGLTRIDAYKGDDKDRELLAAGQADYLSQGKGGGVALSKPAEQTLDSSVGFSTAPPAAKLGEANKHIGVGSVVGGWAYQGSRAALAKGQMLNAQGRYVNSVDAASGAARWRAEVTGKNLDANAQVFSPPALGKEYMYLSSGAGFLMSVRQNDGEAGLMYALGRPMVFQPALAQGNIYVGTADGLLICLKTGHTDAEGWHAWGGNAQHNK